MSSPCVTCGACCAGLPVQFHRDHVTPRGIVPRGLVEPSPTPRHVRMCGSAAGRCVALDGVVGASVSCSIYARRPPPCRDFEPDGLDGIANPGCDAARAAHGLPPLRRAG